MILNILSAILDSIRKKEGELERHFFGKHKDYDEKYPLESQSRT